jgi:hypothetical protein
MYMAVAFEPTAWLTSILPSISVLNALIFATAEQSYGSASVGKTPFVWASFREWVPSGSLAGLAGSNCHRLGIRR